MREDALERKRAAKREYMREYYARNSERLKAQVRERYLRDSADPALLEKRRAAARERERRYRARHPERVKKMAAARQRRYYASDPIGARHAQWRYYYGIKPEDYAAMFEKQGGKCAICASPPPEGKLLHVDHDHDTGAVRGLLCRGCNLALGYFKDSEAAMLNAVAYLRSSAGA